MLTVFFCSIQRTKDERNRLACSRDRAQFWRKSFTNHKVYISHVVFSRIGERLCHFSRIAAQPRWNWIRWVLEDYSGYADGKNGLLHFRIRLFIVRNVQKIASQTSRFFKFKYSDNVSCAIYRSLRYTIRKPVQCWVQPCIALLYRIYLCHFGEVRMRAKKWALFGLNHIFKEPYL